MSGKPTNTGKADAVKVKRRAFGVINSNAPYPSIKSYASKKELGAFQTQLDAMLEEIKQQVENELDSQSDQSTSQKI